MAPVAGSMLARSAPSWRSLGIMRTAKTMLALLLFWLVVVPPASWVDVAIGIVAAALVVTWSRRFLWRHAEPYFSTVPVARLPRFAAVMAVRIVTAAVQVLAIVLNPRLPIAPELIEDTVAFRTEAARVTYANAITATPGTLTVDVRGDTFIVHCLAPALARDVTEGGLARDVKRLFGEAS